MKQDNPFAGFANVRVTKVRLWADGVTTADGQLQVRITHTGNETVVSQHNQGYPFSHDPVTLLEYNVELDLSGLTSATLEFHITSYTFV